MKKIKYNYYCKSENRQYYQKYVKILEANNFYYDKNDYDLIIAFGGDGTLLLTIHDLIKKKSNNIPILVFNTGQLGFLIPFSINDFGKTLKNFASLKIVDLNVFSVNVDEKIFYFVNEIVINNMNSVLDIKVSLNNKLITQQKTSGYIISTNVGSNAFNKSLDGPVIYSNYSLFSIKPIAAINNLLFHGFNNALITDNNFKFEIKSDNYLIIDGLIKRKNISCVESNEKIIKIKILSNDFTYLHTNITKKILK